MAITSAVLIEMSPLTSAAPVGQPAGRDRILRKCRCTATTSTVLIPALPGERAAKLGGHGITAAGWNRRKEIVARAVGGG